MMSLLEIYGIGLVIILSLMTFRLMRVSGVTLLEKTMTERPGYQEYVERNSAFFPWLPRKGR